MLSICFLQIIKVYYVQIKISNAVNKILAELQIWIIVNKLSVSTEEINYTFFSLK